MRIKRLFRFIVVRSLQLMFQAKALQLYWQRYGRLPSSLSAVGAYKTPCSIWESRPSGPEPWYLPVDSRADGTEFIICVEARTPRNSGTRGCVVLGDPIFVRMSSTEQLQELLDKDDTARAQQSQPGRWETLPWRD